MFFERQVMPMVVFIGVGLLFGTTLYFIFHELARNPTLLNAIILLVIPSFVFLVIFNLLVMDTRVDERGIHIKLGWVPVFHYTLKYENLERAEPKIVKTPLWWGLGIRWAPPHEGKGTWAYVAGAREGVLLIGKKHNYVIGTYKPEELCKVLAEKLMKPR
ncbi:MAG: hypothetical protein QXU40_03615 [Candidatus Pacearchaeota archaeon]